MTDTVRSLCFGQPFISIVQRLKMTGLEIKLEFIGRFGLAGDHEKILFHDPVSKKPGIYLWTVPYAYGDSIITYVGETSTTFRKRLKEHIIQTAGGNYRICDPDLAMQGIEHILWNGLWRKGTRDKMPEFLERIVELAPAIKESLEIAEIWVAIFHGEKRIRQRIEGALAKHIKEQPQPSSSLLPKDIRYYQRRKDEAPISVTITGASGVYGLPRNITA